MAPKPRTLAVVEDAPLSRAQRREAAIQLRARGHSLRWIGDRLSTPLSTVHDWLSTPEASDEMARVAREALPELEADAALARLHLRDRVLDTSVDGRDRDRCAAVLLANYARAIEVAAKAGEADAAQGQAVNAAEMKELRKKALADLARELDDMTPEQKRVLAWPEDRHPTFRR